MSIKITTLIENMPDEKGRLAYEHGFSVFVEADGKRLLFDTGQSGAFVKNAEVLGIDLENLDAVILSHGHYDHTGGVPALLEQLNKKTPFYIGKEFFKKKYKRLEDGSWKYNGISFSGKILTETGGMAGLQVVAEDVTRLSENIVLFKNFSRVTDFEEVNRNFFVEEEGTYVQDLFRDEIALGLLTEDGVVLVAGCSHVGIVNMLAHVKRVLQKPVAAVVGGTHLVEADGTRLAKTVEAFRFYGVKRIAVSHCTGEAGMELLKKEFPEEFVLNNTGTVMEF